MIQPQRSTYDKFPIAAEGRADACVAGWAAIAGHLRALGAKVIVVETYPGVRGADCEALADALGFACRLDANTALRSPAAIEALLVDDLSDDPVFGRLSRRDLADLFDAERLAALRLRVDPDGALIFGVGAAWVTHGDVLIYADLPRWEIQQRQRRGELGNLGAANENQPAAAKYKRAYFADWRLADSHKRQLWPKVDYFLDTTDSQQPKLVAAADLDDALARAARQPLRVVPLFDPAPWGGQWMKEVCDLPRAAPNYGWCFDCVPEENSLLLRFGAEVFEIPATDLVQRQAEALLGEDVVRRFGGEFPIRFDFLDTVGGGNLSLQVHPLRDYMRRHFGLTYTQDESYYILDALPEAFVHLGLKTGVGLGAVAAALAPTQSGHSGSGLVELVNRFPARKHDHFLIPAGTIHGSGAGCLVLEISATPYLFTFKLYDWDRPGLDGRPRPLHVDHGLANLRCERDTAYARGRLFGRHERVAAGQGWWAERTGLHEDEPIETLRHWFTEAVPHDTAGTVQVMNLVEGEVAIVESPTAAFAPLVVHYAETFIVPAAVGAYSVRPLQTPASAPLATVRACVRR